MINITHVELLVDGNNLITSNCPIFPMFFFSMFPSGEAAGMLRPMGWNDLEELEKVLETSWVVFYGIFMGFSWDFHGISRNFIGFSLDFHGIFMGFLGISLDCHWIFIGFSLDFHGIFMGFYGISRNFMGFHGILININQHLWFCRPDLL